MAGVVVALVYMPDSWPTLMGWLVVLVGIGLFGWGPLRRIVAWATSHFVVTTERSYTGPGWFAKR